MENPPNGEPPRMENPLPPRGNPPGRNPPWGSRLQHTVYERPVRILLECILVPQASASVHGGGGWWLPRGGLPPGGSASRGRGSASRGVCLQGGVCIQGVWADPPKALRDTVNKRAVRILLECILVFTLVRITSRWPLMATFRLIFLTNLHKNVSKHIAVDLQLRLFAGDAIILIDDICVKLDKPPCFAQIDNHEVRPF